MSRIPYAVPGPDAPQDLVDAILARRGGRLLNLDRMLLRSPAFARGWNAFLGEVRTGLGLSPRLRELAICLVAVLNGADYEFHHHAPEFMKAGGTAQQLAALQRLEYGMPDPALFDASERAVVRLTFEMTRDVRTADATFAAAIAALGNHQHVVELVGVIATYNMVSRFLLALHIEPEAVASRPS
ncbi:carboxymuconolactone decarboxylase family protein [Massilia sp. GER05]|uniref:carboxymuconolactone decarboxylase family protein n=1 Tax=Massilia sp. GER05 TaxID=3394605 RepID=UPI003F85E081